MHGPKSAPMLAEAKPNYTEDHTDTGNFMRRLSESNIQSVVRGGIDTSETLLNPKISRDWPKYKHFATLDYIKTVFPAIYNSVADIMTHRVIKNGEILFVEHGFDNRMYFLLSGLVTTWRKEPLSQEMINNLNHNYKETIEIESKKIKQNIRNMAKPSRKCTSISFNPQTPNPILTPGQALRGIFMRTKDQKPNPAVNIRKTFLDSSSLISSVFSMVSPKNTRALQARKSLVEKIGRVCMLEAIKRRLQTPYLNDNWKVKEKKAFYSWVNLLAFLVFTSRWQKHQSGLMHVKNLRAGDSYGEFLIGRTGPCLRNCSAIAEQDTEVLEIDIREFFKVVDKHRRKIAEKNAQFFKDFRLFKNVQKEILISNFSNTLTL
jgi:CRP-like cAMP-binding protein